MALKGWFRRRLGRSADIPPAAPERDAWSVATRDEAPPREEAVPPLQTFDSELIRRQILERLGHLEDIGGNTWDETLVELLMETVAKDELDLPRFPVVSHRLLRLTPDSPLDNQRIAELVSHDQDITGRVIQLANSALLGKEPVRSLPQAVGRLGTETVRQVAIGVSIQGVVYRVPGYQQHADALRHSGFECGTFAADLTRTEARTAMAGPAFLSGLFRDVGQVIVLRNLSTLRSRTRGGRASRLLIRRLIGELHGLLGIYYGLERRLPEPVIGAIAHHHNPGLARGEAAWLAWAVWSYDSIVQNQDILSDETLRRSLHRDWPDQAPDLDQALACFQAIHKPRYTYAQIRRMRRAV